MLQTEKNPQHLTPILYNNIGVRSSKILEIHHYTDILYIIYPYGKKRNSPITLNSLIE